MSLDNKYPEAFKINLVKRYFNGERQKDICKEFNISKSTFWGWECKYGPLVKKEWQLGTEIEISENNDYIDIRRACNSAIKSYSLISTILQSTKEFKIFFILTSLLIVFLI